MAAFSTSKAAFRCTCERAKHARFLGVQCAARSTEQMQSLRHSLSGGDEGAATRILDALDFTFFARSAFKI